MKKIAYSLPVGSLICLIFIMNIGLTSCIAQQENIPMHKLYNIKWVHSHEDDEGDIEAYRPESYSFPPSRGRRGFKMLKNNSFINYEIAPTDGSLERKGTWKGDADGRFAILFGEKDQNRNYTMKIVSYKKKLLKLKIIQN